MLIKDLPEQAMFRHKGRTYHKWGNLIASNQVLAWHVVRDKKKQVTYNNWKIFDGNQDANLPVIVEHDEPDGLE